MEVSKVNIKAMTGEFIGSFALIYILIAVLSSSGSVAFSLAMDVPPAVIVSLVVATVVLVVGLKHGSHLNPAVTIGAWTKNKIDASNAFAFLVAQASGMFLAWLIAGLVAGDVAALFKIDQMDDSRVFFSELMGALILGFGYAYAWANDLKNWQAAAFIGFIVLLSIAAASLHSHGFVNPIIATPVRAFSWSYILGPIIGVWVGIRLFDTLK